MATMVNDMSNKAMNIGTITRGTSTTCSSTSDAMTDASPSEEGPVSAVHFIGCLKVVMKRAVSASPFVNMIIWTAPRPTQPNGSGEGKTVKGRRRITITWITIRNAAVVFIGIDMKLRTITNPPSGDKMSKMTDSMAEADIAPRCSGGRMTRRRHFEGAAGSHHGERRSPCRGMSSSRG